MFTLECNPGRANVIKYNLRCTSSQTTVSKPAVHGFKYKGQPNLIVQHTRKFQTTLVALVSGMMLYHNLFSYEMAQRNQLALVSFLVSSTKVNIVLYKFV